MLCFALYKKMKKPKADASSSAWGSQNSTTRNQSTQPGAQSNMQSNANNKNTNQARPAQRS
ncbi:hypothetical protein C8R46DRAFT_1231252 [Mycena filopes]|nr:hypothetical protein C8R46DRAFT_1231252 [Mycena filopes]